MTATKILWGQILVVFAIVLATIWSATQWTAWRLGFQPQLGTPWFELAGLPVYQPPAFFWWWYVYDAYAPRIFVEGAFIAASGGFVAIAVAIGMSVWRAREASECRDLWLGALGRRATRSRRPAFSDRTAWCSAGSTATICATTARSTCCASRRPGPARASASSFRRC